MTPAEEDSLQQAINGWRAEVSLYCPLCPQNKCLMCFCVEFIFWKLAFTSRNYWVCHFSLSEQASERLVECKRYESAWINAISLCKMAAEAACTSGEKNLFLNYGWMKSLKSNLGHVLLLYKVLGIVAYTYIFTQKSDKMNLCFQELTRHPSQWGQTSRWPGRRWKKHRNFLPRQIRSWLRQK